MMTIYKQYKKQNKLYVEIIDSQYFNNLKIKRNILYNSGILYLFELDFEEF